MAIFTTDFTVEWNPTGSSWVDISSHIQSIESGSESAGNRDNALTFGSSAESKCTVKTVDLTIMSTAFDRVPIRAKANINGAGLVYTFNGVITGRGRDLESLTFECEGFKFLIEKTHIYTVPYFRRPVATRTDSATIENPLTAGYKAGLINQILWQAGGRPYEQAGSYTTATFYYSCDQALIAPDWSWLAGDNAYEVALKCCEAAGGQLYQGSDGVVYYRQPLAFGDGSSTYTFTSAIYGDVEERTSSNLTPTKVLCPFVPRELQDSQEIYHSTDARLVETGATTTYVLEPKWPVYSIDTIGGLVPSGLMQVQYLDGAPVIQGASGYTHTIVALAQHITMTFTNTSGRPFQILDIKLRGRPIVAGEAENVTSGTGTVVLNIQENYLIQSRDHAQRLADMSYAFHGSSLPLVTLRGCTPNPDRYVGETVGLTVSQWSYTAVQHLIVATRMNDTNTESEYDLVKVAGLPVGSSFFKVATTTQSSNRKLSW